MKFTALHIDGFGVFLHRSFRDLDSPLVLMLGENEAGKTTLLAFIRTILFGFPRANARENPSYPPLGGGPHGGRIDIVLKNGSAVSLSRTPGAHGGRVLIESAGDDDTLHRLLNNITYAVYRNIYAFGLSELQSFETLKGDDITGAVYGAGFGAGLRALPQVKRLIQGRMEKLFKPGGAKPLINLGMTAIENVLRSITIVKNQIHRFDEAMAQKEHVEEEISALSKKLDQHRGQEQVFSVYKRLWPEWITLQEYSAALSALAPIVTVFPETGLQRIEGLLANVGGIETELTALSAEKDQLSTAITRLRVDDLLLSEADEIMNLIREKTAFLERSERLPALLAEKDALEKKTSSLLESIGLATEETGISQINRSILTREAIREFHHRFEKIDQDLIWAEGHCLQTENRLSEIDRDIAAAEKHLSALGDSPPEFDAIAVLKLKQGRDHFAETLRNTAELRIRQAQAAKDFEQNLAEIGSQWQESDLDHFDVSISAKTRAEQLSNHLDDAQRNLLIAETSVHEKTLHLTRQKEKWQATRNLPLPKSLFASWWAISIGVLAAGIGIQHAWNHPEAQWPVILLSVVLGYLIFMLQRLRALHHERQRFKQHLDALAYEVELAEKELAQSTTEKMAAQEALNNVQTTWHAFLKEFNLGDALSPKLLMTVFSKVEMTRDKLRTLRDIQDRLHRMASLESSYAKIALDLLGLSQLPDNSGATLLQAVDLFIARLPELDRQREAINRAQETLRQKTEERKLIAIDLDLATSKLNTLKDKRVIEVSSWSHWLATTGLPPALSPKTALEALDVVTDAQRVIDQQRLLSEEISRIEDALRAFHGRVLSLMAKLGQALPENAALWPIIIDNLAEAVSENRENRRERENHSARLASIDERIISLQHLSVSQKEAMDSLLQEAGAETEIQFREFGKAYDERRRLLAAISETERNLRRISGEINVTALKEQLASLSLASILAAEKAEADASTETAQLLDEMRNKRAELLHEIAALSSNEEMARLRIEEACLRAELKRHVFDWSRYALANFLLDQARETFEKTHQPQVIQDAGQFFSHFTGGRYTQLRAPMGEKSFRVVRTDHASMDPSLLSRGTAEQLYLAVRFGLIRHRALSEEPLPVVMDDILVNFDPTRASACAEAIVELSKTHQVFFLSCHPETIQLFQKITDDFRLLKL